MYATFTDLIRKKTDDGPVRAETCSLIYNKCDVLDVNVFNIILVYLLTRRDALNQIQYRLCTKMENFFSLSLP